MERIQSAISKAREARRALDPQGPATVAADPAATSEARPAAPQERAVEAWSGLMEFRPNEHVLERGRVVSLTSNAASVPFDSMRTRLLYLIRDKGWRRIAVTSPGPGCGKTTISLNLALSLSRLADVRTVLIDADLRRPALGKTLGVSARHQFSDVLAGKADPARHLVRIGDSLAVGTNCAAVPNSAELLQSPNAQHALDLVEETYQPSLMLFDLPPMLVNDDALAAVTLMDAVIVVAAAGASTAAEIDRCEQELASRTNVVGVVLNKCRYLDKSEGYGYDYH